MLALAISVLSALAGIIAVLVIADTLMKARLAYAALMHEGELLRAGLALEAAAEMQRRPMPARRAVTPRRLAGTPAFAPLAVRPLQLQACVAA